MKNRHAFTLVEMLVVIAILGIIAGLVLNLNANAQKRKREGAVLAELTRLKLMIDNYQAKLGYYPPDNAMVYPGPPAVPISGMVSGSNVPTAIYETYTSTNPLLYELTGATNNPGFGTIQFFDGTTNQTGNFSNIYNRPFVANANVDEPHNFFVPGPQFTDYAQYTSNYPGICGLVVPVQLNPTNASAVNYWHYDASSPSRHNQNSYDLWAEYVVGSKNGVPIFQTNGNW